MKTGLVLSGGGARGAYQAGVIQALCEVAQREGMKNPFKVISGISAGSINGAYLASHCHDMDYAGKNITRVWRSISTDKIVNISPFSFGRTGLQLFKQFATKVQEEEKDKLTGLIDTAPLYELIKGELRYNQIADNLKTGTLDAFAVTATSYSNSDATTFIQSHREIEEWKRVRRRAKQTVVGVDHIMASSAIPILFPPYEIDGTFYGDGAIRNFSPLSPSIHLGVEQIISVGVRMKDVDTEIGKLGGGRHPSIGHVLSTLVHGLLMDAIDLDVERLDRLNEMAKALDGQKINGREYKQIDYLWISPSRYLGEIAERWIKTAPKSIRFFLFGIGAEKEQADLLSYLLFEQEYLNELIELGYSDAFSQEKEVLSFLKRAS